MIILGGSASRDLCTASESFCVRLTAKISFVANASMDSTKWRLSCAVRRLEAAVGQEFKSLLAGNYLLFLRLGLDALRFLGNAMAIKTTTS